MAATAYPFASQLRQEAEAKGKAEGKAEMITEILDDRGITMDDADRERILACSHLETLGTWRQRALRISVISELFA